MTIIINKTTIMPKQNCFSNLQRLNCMKLYDGKIGNTYQVDSVTVDEAITRRLEALGVNEKTPVCILNKKKSGTVIIKVRGTRLALGRKITGGIEIEEAPLNESR